MAKTKSFVRNVWQNMDIHKHLLSVASSTFGQPRFHKDTVQSCTYRLVIKGIILYRECKNIEALGLNA